MTVRTAESIRAVPLPGAGTGLMGPWAPAWDGTVEATASLSPTPLGAQPSAYVQKSWEDRPYGQVPAVHIRAAIVAGSLYLRLAWPAPDPRPAITDNNVFADACAILFPSDGRSAELATMGDEERAVEAWYWRAATPAAFVLTARGLGTTERHARHGVVAEGDWLAGEWRVVFCRALDTEGVPLRPGGRVPAGIAVWQGAAGERAGLKSHTPAWLRLQLPG